MVETNFNYYFLNASTVTLPQKEHIHSKRVMVLLYFFLDEFGQIPKHAPRSQP